MDEIGNFLKIGNERIKIVNLMRYRKRRETWVKPPFEEPGEPIPMVTFHAEFFHNDGYGLIIQSSIDFTEAQETGTPQAESDCDLLMAELDTFFTGYKAKDGYGDVKPK